MTASGLFSRPDGGSSEVPALADLGFSLDGLRGQSLEELSRRRNARDLWQPAIVDNFLARVLGDILGRFFTGHRPWS